MGIAAYNRGSNAMSEKYFKKYDARYFFDVIDRLNLTKKIDDPNVPLSAVQIENSNGVYFLQDVDHPYDGFSIWYKDIKQLLTRWNIILTGYNTTTRVFSCQVLDGRLQK